jgi:U3 small nucleolar RNA-associated protein 7
MAPNEDETTEKATIGVSRGTSEKDARRRHKELTKKVRSNDEVARVKKYDAEESQKDRLERLGADHDISDKLDNHQKRALKKRKTMKNKSTTSQLQLTKTKRYEAAVLAADAQAVLHTDASGFIGTESVMERTTALTQVELRRDHLDEQTARQIYTLNLPRHSPYGCKFDRSGRYSVLYGQRGHVAVMDSHHINLHAEFHVKERIRDAAFLHNFSMIAVAQTNHVYVYDDTGAEIHKMSDLQDPFAIDFLPHHWLLNCVGRQGILRFQDVSTGQLVSLHSTKLGPCDVLRQSQSNAVTHLGHNNGTVTLWAPSSSQYLAKILCHKGAKVTSLALDLSGRYMVSGGADRQVKVWDLRMLKNTHAYYVAAGTASSIDISQRGIVAIGHASHATFWSPEALTTNVKDPYMHHSIAGCGPVETIRFRPFQDVCAIGHSTGISSIVVPGSGEANVDSSEYNLDPFQDKKQRREAEVRALLDKLDPNMITLDPKEIGGIEESTDEIRRARLIELEDAANAHKKTQKEKRKKRGRSKIQTKLRRKRNNIVDEQILKLREARINEKRALEETPSGKDVNRDGEEAPSALKRFFS